MQTLTETPLKPIYIDILYGHMYYIYKYM